MMRQRYWTVQHGILGTAQKGRDGTVRDFRRARFPAFEGCGEFDYHSLVGSAFKALSDDGFQHSLFLKLIQVEDVTSLPGGTVLVPLSLEHKGLRLTCSYLLEASDNPTPEEVAEDAAVEAARTWLAERLHNPLERLRPSEVGRFYRPAVHVNRGEARMHALRAAARRWATLHPFQGFKMKHLRPAFRQTGEQVIKAVLDADKRERMNRKSAWSLLESLHTIDRWMARVPPL